MFKVLQYLGKLLLMRTFCTIQLPDAHLTTFCFNFLLNNQTKRAHIFSNLRYSNCLYTQFQRMVLEYGFSDYCRIIEHVNQPIRRGQSLLPAATLACTVKKRRRLTISSCVHIYACARRRLHPLDDIRSRSGNSCT
jgi:hypothetical protein